MRSSLRAHTLACLHSWRPDVALTRQWIFENQPAQSYILVEQIKWQERITRTLSAKDHC
jgi:hypothetical protein